MLTSSYYRFTQTNVAFDIQLVLHDKGMFKADKNNIEQYCAANIVQCCQQYRSVLFHLIQAQHC